MSFMMLIVTLLWTFLTQTIAQYNTYPPSSYGSYAPSPGSYTSYPGSTGYYDPYPYPSYAPSPGYYAPSPGSYTSYPGSTGYYGPYPSYAPSPGYYAPSPGSNNGYYTTDQPSSMAGCSNTNYGSTDPYGDGCDVYITSWCGPTYDDDDFTADRMCCICGGGEEEVCQDTDNGLTDSEGMGCSQYDTSTVGTSASRCGMYETSTFSSHQLCCACGGGEASVLTCLANETKCHDAGYDAYGSWQSNTYCVPSSTGCPCNSGQKSCRDGSCVDRYYGSCPCFADEIACHQSGYDENNTYYSYDECVLSSTGCPCQTWETKCWDGSCVSSSYGACPCLANENMCYIHGYDANYSYFSYYECRTTCPCADYETTCPDGSCVYTYGGICPCPANTTSCTIESFDEYGMSQYGSQSQICINASEAQSSGCPCNSQWQKQCREPGGDSYCTWKDSCCNSEQYCSLNIYDSALNYLGMNYSCVPYGEECPCSQYENKCYMNMGSYNYSYCTTARCPCQAPQKHCWQYSYDSNGYYHYLSMNNFTCVNSINECICSGSNTLSTGCSTTWGDFQCEPVSIGSCPVVCDSTTQKECIIYWSRDVYGWITDHYDNFTKSCVSYSSPCPCHPDHEVSCSISSGYGSYTSSYDQYSCANVREGCPCSTRDCYGYSYYANGSKVETCDTVYGYCWADWEKRGCAFANDTCPCDSANEWTCTVDYSYGYSTQECYPKAEYSGCPVTCGWDEYYCQPDSYDSDGNWKYGETICKSTWDEYVECMATCGENAHQCLSDYGYNGHDSYYCAWDGIPCPANCATEGKQNCTNYLYDENGYFINSTSACYPHEQECPRCHPDMQECYPGKSYSYCTHPSDQCPVECDWDQRYCGGEHGYFMNGSFDDTNVMPSSCVGMNEACPCGSNALTCLWHDTYYNYTYSSCMPPYYMDVEQHCPITCLANEQSCTISNYDVQGNMISYSYQCIGLEATCPCGTNQTRCDEMWGTYSYCQPSFDSYNNMPQQCPLYCNYDEEHCSIPNFDADGNALSTTDYCAPWDSCDCSRGQNAKACTTTYSYSWTNWDGSTSTEYWNYTECVHSAVRCVMCTTSQVSCPDVETYDSTGDYLGTVAPPSGLECVANISQCPCGSGAVKCTIDGRTECRNKYDGCPLTCSSDEKSCHIVDYTVNGTVDNDRQHQCVPSNSTCPCGVNALRCPVNTIAGISEECAPKYDQDGGTFCPCTTGQQVCNVRNYDATGNPTGTTQQCVLKTADCPCGNYAKRCIDPRDSSLKTCIPTHKAAGNNCPMPCTIAQENAGNKTCRIENVDSSGATLGTRITCQRSCTAGNGFKNCPTGAMILSTVECRDIYGLLTEGSAVPVRRLKMVQGQQEASTLMFFLENLQSQPDNVETIRTKLDSTLQLLSALQSDLSAQYSNGKATMHYQVTNLGTANVKPSEVTEKLRGYLNSKSDDVVNALQPIGSIQVGANGCCTVATQQKTIVVTDATTTTAAPTTAPPSTTSNPVQAPVRPTPAAASTGTSTTGVSTSEITLTGSSTSEQSLTAGSSTSEITLPGTSTPESTLAGSSTPSTTGSGTETLTMGSTASFSASTAGTTPQEVTAQETTTIPVAKAMIIGSIQMTMSDDKIDAAIADPAFKGAVTEGIATSAQVDKQHVDVEFRKERRRLKIKQKRRLASTLHVDYTIELPATHFSLEAQQATHETLKAVKTDDLTTAVNSKLASANLDYTVIVTSISVPSMVVETVTTTNSPGIESNGTKRGTSTAHSCLLHALGVSLMLFFFG